MWRRIPLVVAALVAAAGLTAVPRPVVDEAGATHRPVRVMLVGDSVTSGQTLIDGIPVVRTEQWPTFRGALYEKLTGSGTDGEVGDKYGREVDFVGSEDGVGRTFDDAVIDASPATVLANLACPSTNPDKQLVFAGETLDCDYDELIEPESPIEHPAGPGILYPLVDADHEGHDSWTVDDLIEGRLGAESVDGKLADWMAAERPDVVVFYAGTNDLHGGQQPAAVLAEMRQAVAVMQAARPGVRIVVPQLHPHRNTKARTDAIRDLNALIPGMVEDESTATSPVITADLFIDYCAAHQDPGSVAPTECPHYNADGSHPNALGHALIAERLGDAMEAAHFLDEPIDPEPEVDAGSARSVVRPDPAQLDATVVGATSVLWSKVDGPGTVTFSPPGAVDTAATFSASGSYTLRLTATNSHGSSADTVQVTVTDPPSPLPGPGPTPGPGPAPTPGPGPAPQPADPSGYVVLEGDGELYAFGDARAGLRAMDPGSIDVAGRQATVSSALVARLGGASAVAVELTADGSGLWVLADDGRILELGTARRAPGVSSAVLDRTVAGVPERVSALARVGSGDLWVFTTAGRVVAQFGKLPGPVRSAMNVVLGLDLRGPVVDAKPTIDGTGVVAMASDGGVFTYDAPFLGSVYDAIASASGVPVGSVGPDRPVVGVTMDPDGDGYWVVAEDGGVFTMRSPFRGALPAFVPFDQLVAPVNGMVPAGTGYVLVAGDGGVFDFSDHPFAGSAAGLVDSSVTDIAAR